MLAKLRSLRPGLRVPAAAVATAAALALAGCGGGTTITKDGTLRIGLEEYRVVPQSVHTTAGVLTLVVHNYGRLTHNLVISLDGHDQIATKPLVPGQTAVLDAALIPGDYTLSSSILNDQALGLYGTLAVSR
ncbi:MAG: hypothetical protein ACRDMJ_03250 [Solirubrobacteraceae bacterium]